MHNKQIKPGKYRHYKGGEYQVYDIAVHSEDESAYVVYRPLYGESKLWIRPLDMFLENVEVDGKLSPRFAYVGDMAQGEAGKSQL